MRIIKSLRRAKSRAVLPLVFSIAFLYTPQFLSAQQDALQQETRALMYDESVYRSFVDIVDMICSLAENDVPADIIGLRNQVACNPAQAQPEAMRMALITCYQLLEKHHTKLTADEDLSLLVAAMRSCFTAVTSRAPRPNAAATEELTVDDTEIIELPRDVEIERDLFVGRDAHVDGDLTVNGDVILTGTIVIAGTTFNDSVTIQKNPGDACLFIKAGDSACIELSGNLDGAGAYQDRISFKNGFTSTDLTTIAHDGSNFVVNSQVGNQQFQTGGTTRLSVLSGGGVQVPAFSTGVVHSNGSGLLSSSLIVNADVDAAAAIAYSKLNLTNSIVNADINAAAGIVDTKLATISTAGKVANSATTATTASTPNTIVLRDGSGNIPSGTTLDNPTIINGMTVRRDTTNNALTVNGTGNVVIAAPVSGLGLQVQGGGATIAGATTMNPAVGEVGLAINSASGVDGLRVTTAGTAFSSLASTAGQARFSVIGAATAGSGYDLRTGALTHYVRGGSSDQLLVGADSAALELQTTGVTRLSLLSGGGVQVPAFSTGVVHSNGIGLLSSSLIVNADVDAAAGIVDTKLATISTAGKVANSATTATTANTANTIVLRDGSGNIPSGATLDNPTIINGMTVRRDTTNNALTVNGTGNVTVESPTAGSALTVNALAGTNGIVLNSTGVTSIQINAGSLTNSGLTINTAAPSLATHYVRAVPGAGHLEVHSDGNLLLSTNPVSTTRMTIDAIGQVTVSGAGAAPTMTINAPVTGTTLQVNGNNLTDGILLNGVGATTMRVAGPATFSSGYVIAQGATVHQIRDDGAGVLEITPGAGDLEITGRTTMNPASGVGLTINSNSGVDGLRVTTAGTAFSSLASTAGLARFSVIGAAAAGSGYDLVTGAQTHYLRGGASDQLLVGAGGIGLELQTAGISRVTVNTAGAVAIATPSAGTALTVNAAPVTNGIILNSTGGTSIQINAGSLTNSGLTINTAAPSAAEHYVRAVTGASDLEVHAADTLRLSTNPVSTTRMTINGIGQVTVNAAGAAPTMTINAPVTGTTLQVNANSLVDGLLVDGTGATTMRVSGGAGLSSGYIIAQGAAVHQIRDDGASVLQLTPAPISNLVRVNSDLSVIGTLTKGAGAFDIVHPDPVKAAQNMRLRHCFVESASRGDNIYRFVANVVAGTATLQLPDYYKHLNENSQVWVSPVNVFGMGYGVVDQALETVTVSASQDGLYNVLVIGTRKDHVAVEFFDDNGGAEYIAAH